ncbi:hypothetical protein [Cryobacterium sp. AP23]
MTDDTTDKTGGGPTTAPTDTNDFDLADKPPRSTPVSVAAGAKPGLTHDQRGVYPWDGAGKAEEYARALWRVLALVSVPGSIHYRVLPRMRRDEFVRDPGAFGSTRVAIGPDWWRAAQPVSVTGRVREPV